MRSTVYRFDQIFWGLLLVVIKFTFSLDNLTCVIVPDFIGYLLVALGARQLGRLSTRFQQAVAWCWALVFISFVSMFTGGGVAGLMNLITMTLDCVMMWFLLGGFIEFFEQRAYDDDASRLTLLRVIYVVASVVSGLAGWVLPFGACIGVVVMLVVVVFILLSIRTARSVAIETDER